MKKENDIPVISLMNMDENSQVIISKLNLTKCIFGDIN